MYPVLIMALDKLNAALTSELAALEQEGRSKAPERIIVGYVPPSGGTRAALPAAAAATATTSG